MKQLFFGPPALPLFGILHYPPAESAGGEGIVIAPPFANEYFRSYRSNKVLADRLAKLGYFVLRFDYSGTGDSAGDDEDMSLVRWREDLQTSMAQLQEEAGVERIHLVGRRIGAALCIEASTKPEIQRVVLWDPVLNGRDYLAEIKEDHEEFIGMYRRVHRDMKEFQSDLYRFEALGQCFPGDLVDEIETLDLDSALSLSHVRACLIDSSEDQRLQASAQVLEKAGAHIDYRQVVDPWAKDPVNPIRVYLPNAILRAITDWFKVETP